MRLALLLLALLHAAPASAAEAPGVPWWGWPLMLFAVTFVMGIVAVLAGVGGGVLFVPIVGGFFPFHLDFVRGAGLLLALCASLAAGPRLLRTGLASLRLAVPLGLVGSVGSIAGALLGLALPTGVVQTALGATILAIVGLMWRAKASMHPDVRRMDTLAEALALHGVYHDPASRQDVYWKVHRTPAGLAAFGGIGVLGGLFGVGAGWANGPALNLVLGAPLKLSVATSNFVIPIMNTAACWIYINRGAVLPLLTVPSIIGVMLGARIGAQLLRAAPASVIRRIVMAMLLIAGLRALAKGLGLWA